MHSRSSACRALVQQLVVKVSFCARGYGGANPDSKHVARWSRLRRWKMREMLQIYMSCSGLLQHIATGRMDVVFATKEVGSRTAKANVLPLLILKWVTKYLVGHHEIVMNYPYQNGPSQIDCYTDAD